MSDQSYAVNIGVGADTASAQLQFKELGKQWNATLQQMAKSQIFLNSMYASGSQIMEKRYLSSFKGLSVALARFRDEAKGTIVVHKGMVTTLDSGAASLQRFAIKADMVTRTLDNMNTRIINTGKNLQWTGRQLMVGVTAPIVGLGIAAVKTFGDMEKASLRAQKLIGDQTVYKDLEKSARNLSKTWGAAFEDIIKSAGELRGALNNSFTTKDIENLNALAVAFDKISNLQNLPKTSEFVRTIASVTGSVTETRKELELFNAIEEKTAIDMNEITQVWPKVANTFRQWNVSVGQGVGILSAFKENGVGVAEGANAITVGLSRVGQASAGYGVRLKQLRDFLNSWNASHKEAQVTFFDEQGNLLKGEQMLYAMAKAYTVMGDKQKVAFAGLGFGAQRYDEIIPLLNSTAIAYGLTNKNLSGNIVKTSDYATALNLQNEQLKNGAEFSKKFNDASKQYQNDPAIMLQRIKQNIRLIGADIGKELMPKVITITNKIIELLNKFQNLSPHTKRLAIDLAMAAAALGPIVYAMGQLTIMTGVVGRAFTKPLRAIFAIRSHPAEEALGQGQLQQIWQNDLKRRAVGDISDQQLLARRQAYEAARKGKIGSDEFQRIIQETGGTGLAEDKQKEAASKQDKAADKQLAAAEKAEQRELEKKAKQEQAIAKKSAKEEAKVAKTVEQTAASAPNAVVSEAVGASKKATAEVAQTAKQAGEIAASNAAVGAAATIKETVEKTAMDTQAAVASTVSREREANALRGYAATKRQQAEELMGDLGAVRASTPETLADAQRRLKAVELQRQLREGLFGTTKRGAVKFSPTEFMRSIRTYLEGQAELTGQPFKLTPEIASQIRSFYDTQYVPGAANAKLGEMSTSSKRALAKLLLERHGAIPAHLTDQLTGIEGGPITKRATQEAESFYEWMLQMAGPGGLGAPIGITGAAHRARLLYPTELPHTDIEGQKAIVEDLRRKSREARTRNQAAGVRPFYGPGGSPYGDVGYADPAIEAELRRERAALREMERAGTSLVTDKDEATRIRLKIRDLQSEKKKLKDRLEAIVRGEIDAAEGELTAGGNRLLQINKELEAQQGTLRKTAGSRMMILGQREAQGGRDAEYPHEAKPYGTMGRESALTNAFNRAFNDEFGPGSASMVTRASREEGARHNREQAYLSATGDLETASRVENAWTGVAGEEVTHAASGIVEPAGAFSLLGEGEIKQLEADARAKIARLLREEGRILSEVELLLKQAEELEATAGGIHTNEPYGPRRSEAGYAGRELLPSGGEYAHLPAGAEGLTVAELGALRTSEFARNPLLDELEAVPNRSGYIGFARKHLGMELPPTMPGKEMLARIRAELVSGNAESFGLQEATGEFFPGFGGPLHGPSLSSVMGPQASEILDIPMPPKAVTALPPIKSATQLSMFMSPREQLAAMAAANVPAHLGVIGGGEAKGLYNVIDDIRAGHTGVRGAIKDARGALTKQEGEKSLGYMARLVKAWHVDLPKAALEGTAKAGKGMVKGIFSTIAHPVEATKKVGSGAKTAFKFGKDLMSTGNLGEATFMGGGTGTILTAVAPFAIAAAAVAAAFLLIWKNWDKVSKGIGNGLKNLKQAFGNIIHAIIDPFKNLFAVLGVGGDKGSHAAKGMAQTWKSVGTILNGVFHVIAEILNAVATVLKPTFSILADVFGVVINTIRIIIDLLGGNWKQAWEDMKLVAAYAVQAILKIMLLPLEGFLAGIKKLLGILSHLPVVGKTIGKLKDGLGDVQKFVADIPKNVAKHISSDITMEAKAKEKGKKIGKETKKGAQDGLNEGGPLQPPEVAAPDTSNLTNFVSAFQDQMKKELESWKKAAMDAFDASAKRKVKAIDDQIKALDKQKKQEDDLAKAIERKRRQEELDLEIQQELMQYQAQRSFLLYEGKYDEAKLLDLQHLEKGQDFAKKQRDLNEQNAKEDRDAKLDQQKQDLEDQKTALQAQLDQQKQALQDQLDQLTEFIPKNAAEAEKMRKAILDALGKQSGDFKAVAEAQGAMFNHGWKKAMDDAAAQIKDQQYWQAVGQGVTDKAYWVGQMAARGLKDAITQNPDAGGSPPQVSGQPTMTYEQAQNAMNHGVGALPTTTTDSGSRFTIGGNKNVHHAGGPIEGEGPWDIPATLQSGEFVIQRQAAKALGLNTLRRLNNAHRFLKFHTGGLVESLTPGISDTVAQYIGSWSQGGDPKTMAGMTRDDAMNIIRSQMGTTLGLDGMLSLGDLPSYLAGMLTGVKSGMIDIIRFVLGHFPGVRVTSTTGGKHVDNSYHYRGQAADFDFGGNHAQDGGVFSLLKPLAQSGQLAELFFDPLGGWKNGTSIGAIGGHSDHVHAAIADAFANGIAVALTGTAPVQGGSLQEKVTNAMKQQGWGSDQWSSLSDLISHESGWNPAAKNPGSTAVGLFQFLKSTWESYITNRGGVPYWSTNPDVQIPAGLQYIKDRYGTPAHAWAMWQSRSPHWYHQGGPVSLDVGGLVYGDGLAKVHKGEAVVTKALMDSGAGNVTIDLDLHFDGGFFGSDKELEKLVDTIEFKLVPRLQRAMGSETKHFRGYK